jgi:hypothetical protein
MTTQMAPEVFRHHALWMNLVCLVEKEATAAMIAAEGG